MKLKYYLNNIGLISLVLTMLTAAGGCRKYLEVKPDQSIATPTTIDDVESILNNYAWINAHYPSASEVSSGDFYLLTTDFNTLLDAQKAFYTWQKYALHLGTDYGAPYMSVEYANVVLDALPNIQAADQQRMQTAKGAALFVRGSYHFAIAQLFAKPYAIQSAGTDLGIALRTTSDVNVKPVRATIAETYASIIADLQSASNLLSKNVAQKYAPSRPAAWGMLARVYLSMSDYANARRYADSALNAYNTLIDYNTISVGAAIPFKQFNDEVIYDARGTAPAAMAVSKAKVDTVLYALYDTNDLRKSAFFKANANGSKAFKGNYTGLNNATLFTGIATDELYLISAEGYARTGNVASGTQLLNNLLQKRYRRGSFLPRSFSDKDQLLAAILTERRKELLFRSLRWIDLRRLNLSEQNQIILTRSVAGTTYTLQPNSSAYVFAIDQDAVDLSGLQQNP